MSVILEQVGAGMEARGTAYCNVPEHYHIVTRIYRDDLLSNALVADAQGNSNGKAGLVRATALEPCSQLQTNKNYYARLVMYDTTYGYPIEVQDSTTSELKGHC